MLHSRRAVVLLLLPDYALKTGAMCRCVFFQAEL